MLEPASPTLPTLRGALPFLALVFGSTWLFQLPALLAERGLIAGPAERFMPLVVLGFFGPLLMALLLSALSGGLRGVRALYAPFAFGRARFAWYALALCLPMVIAIVARAVLAPFGDLGPWVYPPSQPQQLAAMLIIPFTEQIPWRGYLYPRLERARGPLAASLITGATWALFHVQKHAFIDPNASLASAALTLAYMTSGTVVFSWFFLRTRGSMLVVVVARMGSYLNNPAQALPSLTPLAIHTLGFCVAAAALVLGDRSTWKLSSPRDASVRVE